MKMFCLTIVIAVFWMIFSNGMQAQTTQIPVQISIDGKWRGVTSQGKTISFTVNNNAIDTISFEYELQGNNCGSENTVNLFPVNPPKITTSKFSVNNSDPNVSYIINGTFKTSTNVSGNLQVTIKHSSICTGQVNTAWQGFKDVQ